MMLTTTQAAMQEVEAADRRRVQATLAGDVAALEQIYDDELLYTHSTSRRDIKSVYLDDLRSGRVRYLALDLADIETRVAGDCAVRTGTMRGEVSAGGKQFKIHATFTGVWVKRAAGWKMIAWQATLIPPAA